MPAKMSPLINPVEENVYDPPDVYNQFLHPGFKAVDVVGISESGLDFRQFSAPSHANYYYYKSSERKNNDDVLLESWDSLEPGKGITLVSHAGDHGCDGTLNSFCNRGADNKCLLYAHNDGRGGLLLDSFSGWMLLQLPNVEHGIIVLNMEIWHTESPRTQGWTSVNNENAEQNNSRTLSIPTLSNNNEPSSGRRTSEGDHHLCEDFIFEYSINGVVKRHNRDEFLERKRNLQRIVTIITLLDDENFPSGQVKLALRTVGCARNSAIKLTHIYWA
jgi:hypothetical protein